MAARSPTFAAPSTVTGANTSYFLGIELANDQLRAVLVDEQLSTVGVEVFDFDSEHPEYQLRPNFNFFYLSPVFPGPASCFDPVPSFFRISTHNYFHQGRVLVS